MKETMRITRLFGANIVHSQNELSSRPPEKNAYETFVELEVENDVKRCETILQNAFDVSCFIEVAADDGMTGVEALMTQFTPSQLELINSRLQEYLQMDVSTFLQNPVSPRGYPTYISRLVSYFSGSDTLVTSQFSSFYDRHIDPSPGATGPLEINSRAYATEALHILERQLSEHYQIRFRYTRTGPYTENTGMIDWAPGVAECQFLVLDAMRDFLTSGVTSVIAEEEPALMTVPDIGNNIHELLTNRKTIIEQVGAVNPDIAQRVSFALDGLREHVQETFHRGRPGVLRYTIHPDNARRAILRVEALLVEAQRQSDSEVNQEDIPVLDL